MSQYDSLQTKLTHTSQLVHDQPQLRLVQEPWKPDNLGRLQGLWRERVLDGPQHQPKECLQRVLRFYDAEDRTSPTRFLNGHVNGYQLSGITQLQSGAQLSAASSYYYNIQNGPNGVYSVGTPDVTVAPVVTCNPSLGLKTHQFINPNCLAYPTQGTGIGNTRMPGINGPMYWNSDLAAEKSFAITEHQNLNSALPRKTS